MSRFLIKGGTPLRGEVKIAGSKNAATTLMVASLLTSEPCLFTNFPQIGDASITEELCGQIGSDIRKKEDVVTIETKEIKANIVPQLSRQNRIPILALGPLLARTGEAEVPFLGGDKIGHRPVDLHLNALRALGAEIEIRESSFHAKAPNGLHGAEIVFPFPSVGATENALLASVLAKGKTILKNVAVEPEIIDLIKMLQNMGAIIEFDTDRTLRVDGVEKLRGVHHHILPDRNEAVSFACLAIATGGNIMARGAMQEHLISFLNVVRRAGADYLVSEDGIEFSGKNALKAVSIETAPHPAFMTDWQQPLAVLLTQAEGNSEIHETIYENRFGYAEDLNSMGAKIDIFEDCGENSKCRFDGKGYKHRIVIHGKTPLHAGKLRVRDLRSGMAHIIAGLVADGTTEIEGAEEIDRGYEFIDDRLRDLGADISREI